MTTIAAPAVRSTQVTRSTFWFTAVALAVAAVALTVWLVVRVTSSDKATPAPANKAPVQHSQNQLCAPLPGTRFC